MLVAQDRLGSLAVAGGTGAFLGRIFVNGESRRVDPEFDELAWPDMPFNDFGRDVEVLWVRCVHGDPVDQLVIVGERLVVELLFK